MSVVIGVDYGERRIGLAVSDPDREFAFAREVATVRHADEALAAVRRLGLETRAAAIIVGLPLNMDGSAGPMARSVLAFVEGLREALAMPVYTWDERLSTAMAERVLIEADMSRRHRRRVRDKMAARNILQGWLDAERFRAGSSAAG